MAIKQGIMLALMAGLGLGQAYAEDAEALAKANGCLSCHQVERKVVGPAYQDVAKKYRGDPGAAAMLAVKVRQGGKGVWGPVPMPPQTRVSDSDLRLIIDWVLSR